MVKALLNINTPHALIGWSNNIRCEGRAVKVKRPPKGVSRARSTTRLEFDAAGRGRQVVRSQASADHFTRKPIPPMQSGKLIETDGAYSIQDRYMCV